MRESPPQTDVVIRPYRDGDEPGVLHLLSTALGGGPMGRRAPEFFRWKHVDNPFGRSFMLVAESGDRIVGLRAFLRWRFRAGDRTLDAVRAVDTATSPDLQGRGIFSRLTTEAVRHLREDVDLVFNTPNEKSLPGYLKMGWQVAGRVPVRVRARRPLRLAVGWRGQRSAAPVGAPPAVHAPRAGEVLSDGAAVETLLSSADPGDGRLSTIRDLGYLRWRFASSPLDYRALTVEGDHGLAGLVLFRVRPRGRLWEATVADLIVPRGARGVARRLLRAVSRSSSVDHLTCSFPPGLLAPGVLARSGFVPVPGGITLAVNVLRPGVEPDPLDLGSWALSLGDLEVF